jgi:hypothetical protein
MKLLFYCVENNLSYQHMEASVLCTQANGLGLNFLVNCQLKWFRQSQRREKNFQFDFFVYEGLDSWHTLYVLAKFEIPFNIIELTVLWNLEVLFTSY